MSDDAGKDDKHGSLINVVFKGEDVAGIGQAFKSLMDAIVRGAGAGFEPLLRSRMHASNRDGLRGMLREVKRSGLPLTEIDITTVEGRADYRIRAERERQQSSREAVALHAITELPAIVRAQGASEQQAEPEPEWLNRFWRLAQDIEAEDLQSLWGRVLARQAAGTARISARTLEALSLIDRREADELTRLAALVVHVDEDEHACWVFGFQTPNRHVAQTDLLNVQLKEQFQSFDYGHYESIGVTGNAGFAGPLSLGVSEKELRIANRRFIVGGRGAIAFEGLTVDFSQTGREILSLIETEPNQEFMRLLFEAFKAADLTWREV